jgi:hypothetical protein
VCVCVLVLFVAFGGAASPASKMLELELEWLHTCELFVSLFCLSETIYSLLTSHGDRLDRRAHPHCGDPSGLAETSSPTRALPRRMACSKQLTPHSLPALRSRTPYTIDFCCRPAI